MVKHLFSRRWTISRSADHQPVPNSDMIMAEMDKDANFAIELNQANSMEETQIVEGTSTSMTDR